MSDLYDAQFVEVMRRKVGESNLTAFHLYLIGNAVLNHLGTTVAMGHATPASTLDYLEPGSHDPYFDAGAFVRDIVAWSSGRPLPPTAEAEARAFFDESGWLTEQGAKITRLVTEALTPQAPDVKQAASGQPPG